MTHSVLANITRSDIRYYPFPHIVAEDCLPASLYAELARTYPTDQTILRLSGKEASAGQNERVDLSAHEALRHPTAVSPDWLEFIRYHTSQAFFQELMTLLGPEFKTTYPLLEESLGHPLDDATTGVRFDPELDRGEISLDCQIGINTPARRKSSVRRVHSDATEELFAMLLYFRHPDDDTEGGDLEIYKWRDDAQRRYIGEAVDERDAVKVAEVPYKANTLVIFINSEISLHAVSERSPSPISRRLVNIIGRTYRSVPDGLFVKQQKHGVERLRHQIPRFVKSRILR